METIMRMVSNIRDALGNKRVRRLLPMHLVSFSAHRATKSEVKAHLQELAKFVEQHEDVCLVSVENHRNRVLSEYAMAAGSLTSAMQIRADIEAELSPKVHYRLLAALADAGLTHLEGWYNDNGTTWTSRIQVTLSMDRLDTMQKVVYEFTDDARISVSFERFVLT